MKNICLMLAFIPLELWAQDDTSVRPFDVLINEIMADPTPANGLPEAEYIELFNRTGSIISLKNWKLQVGTTLYSFPECSIKDYLIITSKKDTLRFKSFGKVAGLFTSSTALANTGQFLSLQSPEGTTISWVEYNDSWYNGYKSEGGWSLELMDPSNPCGGKTNWTASKSNSGGTPGFINSVNSSNPDISVPCFVRIAIPTDSVLELHFSESIDISSMGQYVLVPGNILPISVTAADNNRQTFRLSFPEALKGSVRYTLSILQIKDCAGNSMQENISIPFTLPEDPGSSDVVINEVLFNASPGGSEYVELYNRTGKSFDLGSFYISVKDDSNDPHVCRLSTEKYLFEPNSYCLLIKNKDLLKEIYSVDEKTILESDEFPDLNDKAATISVIYGNMLIDEFSYSDKMHLQILKTSEGISLERVNPDVPTGFPGNWHSASESCGYGTPGIRNSQYLSDSVTENEIKVHHEIFSPDNDGYEDLLQISFNNNKPACRAQVYIFDSNGRLIRRLLNNELLGTQGFFTWDGTNEGGSRCNTGMYLFFIRFLFDDGTVREFKRSCILALRK